MKINQNKTRQIYITLILFCLTTSCDVLSQSANNRPVFQLNHVDICIDTGTFNAILKNNFIRDSFSFVKVFKDSTGSEILLLGKEFYIHFLTDNGFFKNRLGACLLVHHSYQKQETKTLIEYLQPFTADSFYNRPYTSPQLNIDYVNVYENLERKESLLKFIPILQNHSVKDYLSWGYTLENLQNGIIQKQYMTDYIGKETEHKLFKSIETISVAVSNTEKTRMPTLLKAYGYKRKGNIYILHGNPIVRLSKIKDHLRKVRLTISLSKQVRTQNIILSDHAILSLKNKTVVLIYKVSENYR